MVLIEKASHLRLCEPHGVVLHADIHLCLSVLGLIDEYLVILVHNHVFGSCLPSKADISATGKINLICSLHGVELLDHVILSKTNLYSFRSEGLLDEIKRDADLNKILSANYGGKN